MSSLVQGLASLVTAAAMLFSETANTAAPQNDFSGNLFLVNRQWRVSKYYVPSGMRTVEVTGKQSMRSEAAAAFEMMAEDCDEATGKRMTAVSGFRSYSKQEAIYANKLKRVKTEAKADEYVARPGASEHQTGNAMDVGQDGEPTVVDSFANTAVGKWLKENCWKYGFILRYGQDWQKITGYKWESWHVRYVGTEVAKEIHEDPQPFETWLLNERAERLWTILGVNEE